MSRKGIALWLTMTMLCSFIVMIVEVAPNATAYTPHDPIIIDGNAHFQMQATSEGWFGNGTEANPYIIEGYEIDASSGYGIIIRFTSVYFIIRNSYIKDGYIHFYDYVGIYLVNVSNGQINNCKIENNAQGIYLVSTQDCFIINNTIKNSSYGIFSDHSSGNQIHNNYLSNNVYNIVLSNDANHDITANIMSDSGIYMDAFEIEYCNTHNIPSSNTVNGKPIYYWKNQNGGTIPSGAGQVILANCSNVRVENQELIDSSIGIMIGYSSFNVISGNTISNNVYGIYLIYSNNNSLINNHISTSSYYGIRISYSNDNRITSNTVHSNEVDGIWMTDSRGNEITNNNLSSNDSEGIRVSDSHGNSIKDNIVYLNDRCGIYLKNSSENTISGNNVSDNTNGIYFDASNSNLILNNIVFYNDGEIPHLHSAYGICLHRSGGNTIKDNNVSLNQNGIGIHYNLNANPIINNVWNNSISLNLENGLNLSFSDWNNIIENNIQENSCGIYILISDNNTFHHNYFINNTIQLTVIISTNIWDNGNNEGNYWSDYTGKDNGNNERTSGDGVGDTRLPHQGVDMHPLTEPGKASVQDQKIPWWLYVIWLITAVLMLMGYFVNYSRAKK